MRFNCNYLYALGEITGIIFIFTGFDLAIVAAPSLLSALAISGFLLSAVGFSLFTYCNGKWLRTFSITKTIELSKAKLDNSAMSWVNSLKDNKGVYIARKVVKEINVSYYLFTPNYSLEKITVNRDHIGKTITFGVTENSNKEETSMISEVKILGDKSEKVILNGKEYDLSGVTELS